MKIIDLLQPECSSSEEVNACISADALITTRVSEYVATAGLDMTKLRGIGTDGASTMTGCHNGVVARLKAITPSAIGVHCAAHRVNLASTQAGDKIPYVKKFNGILRQLFDFFDNSCVRMAGLQAVQNLLEEKGSYLLLPLLDGLVLTIV